MFLKKLSLENFRNYEKTEIGFSDGINILIGANAQGKTNCAEAIFYLCTGYSPKVSKEKELILRGKDRAVIEGVAGSEFGDVKVRAEIGADGEKNLLVNDVKISKMADLFGNMNSVFFNPAELKLVQESPEDRRRFMNVSLSEMSKQYFSALCRYNKILLQRNNLLKTFDYSLINDTLPVWDKQMCDYAAKIFKMRADFIAKLSPYAEKVHSDIAGGTEKLKISLENAVRGSTEEEISDLMYIRLSESKEKDMRLGFTNEGPHREDVKFTLNGTDVRKYGSQGQQRTVALSLKLAEVEVFKERFGEYPILILDDVLSELDRRRQRVLLKRLDGIQTILTATHVESALLKDLPHVKITVENGKIKGYKDKK
ncbi:MAG: DNA replication/repair protein RecF [Clostridia bacterium]|nr:DNA replication/repair protein RecF [Clostridia bacterium]